jgi:hypothetical protein
MRLAASFFVIRLSWSPDDYDVFDGEQRIGRIVWSYAAPRTVRRYYDTQ